VNFTLSLLAVAANDTRRKPKSTLDAFEVDIIPVANLGFYFKVCRLKKIPIQFDKSFSNSVTVVKLAT
jgi:hypothetical protein